MDGHRKGLLPTEVIISVLGNNSADTGSACATSTDSSSHQKYEVDSTSSEEEVADQMARATIIHDDVAKVHSTRRFASSSKKRHTRSRTNKSRGCSEAVLTHSLKINKESECASLPNKVDRFSISSPNLMPIDSDISGSSSSTRTGSERKINRIFSMLQTMQQNFILQQHQLQQTSQSIKERPVEEKRISEQVITPVHSEPKCIRPHQHHLELELNRSSVSSSHKHLFALGRSRDSLTSAGDVSMMTKEKPFPLLKSKSWTGSQCSEFTCHTVMTEEPPPPMVHALPHHKDGLTSLFIVGSSTYAQLLIVVCIVAALAEVVTHNVPFQYFEVYFATLYILSILFFLYVFGYLLRSKRRREEKKHLRKLSKARRLANMSNHTLSSEEESDDYGSINRNASVSMENEIYAIDSPVSRFMAGNREGQRKRSIELDYSASNKREHSRSEKPPHPSQEKALKSWTSTSSVKFNLAEDAQDDVVSYSMMGAKRMQKVKKMKVSDNEHSHGSFFLRAGAVAFGLGTMIYDGLEFGAFLEVPQDSPCFSLIRGLNPLLHATFVFLQMYFIFISARLNIHKFKAIARFGLMHCLATNVCVWIRTLVRESLKEINGHFPHDQGSHGHDESTPSDTFLKDVAQAVAAVIGKNDDSSEESNEFLNDTLTEMVDAAVNSIKSKKIMSLWELTGNVSCGQGFFLGDLIMEAAPFLYPFLIEYSLIGAAVIYVTWSHIGLNPKYKTDESHENGTIWNSKSRQLRIDCVGASKGLFVGLMFLTGSLLCIVLFFIFTPQPQYHRLGLFFADAAHCVLLLVSICAMILGAYRARHLHFRADYTEELGSILLRVTAIGMFSYSVFSMIAGALYDSTTHEPPILVFIIGFLSVIEVTIQTLFISDMSRRVVNTPEHDREKPGRQSVTFLLITNMTLWLVYTFEMQKVEANPVQLNFYGFFPWAIVQRITLPLCIFYRFHSAIVYSEIWKNSYRYHGSSAEAHH